MGIKIKSTRSAEKVIASQKNKQSLGKNNLELGKEYILLFPKKDNEVVVSGIVGRSCNFEELGISFGRLTDDQMEYNEETGRIKDNSGMLRWAALSSILYRAAKAQDIEKKKEEARLLSEKTGTPIDENALAQAIEKVNVAYDGKPRQGDEAAVAPTKQRLISSKVDFNVFTEAVLIPLDKHLKPEFDKALSVEVRLSNTKIKQLNAILDDPNYNDESDPDGFLEVKFSYKGTDRKEAGKNAYLGVESAVRKCDFSKDGDGNYIDSGIKSIAHLLSDTTHDDELMFSRAGTVSFAKTAADVEAAMRKYLSNNRILPLYINMEDELTKKHAKDILDLGCVFGQGTKQYNELLAIIEEQEGNISDNEDETLTGEISKLTEAKSARDIETAVSSNKELEDLVGNDEIADI